MNTKEGNSTNSNAKEIWDNAWKPEIHTTDYALKRIKSAQSAKLTPIKIDADDCYGYFQGSHGRYETWLDHCPCGDYRRSKLPCKHIYRLAIGLGLMDIEVKCDLNAVATPSIERASLDETIDIVEALSEDAQYKLLTIARCIRSTSPTYDVYFDNNIVELINSGLIVNVNPEKYKIEFTLKRDIMSLLDSANIEYDKRAKRTELEKICMEKIPEKAKAVFGITISVSIPGIYSSRNIHYYLDRKYYGEYRTDLPDDAVTEQLIKRGYYTRK